MISIQPRHCRAAFFAALCIFWAVAAIADSKTIRLRNEVISTPPKHAKAAAQAIDKPQSGLLLIQLSGPSKAEWIAELHTRNVTIVQYVPDDAFIARTHGVRLSEIENLPFVRWTGPLKAEHKIHEKIRGAAKKGGDVSVSVLLAPDATQKQLGAARGLLKKVDSESSLRFGHVWRGPMQSGNLKALAESDAVLWIEAAPNMKINDETASKIVAGDGGGHSTYMQSLGYDGSGVVVSVADSGFDIGETDDVHPDVFGRVDTILYYGELEDGSDEHGHGTHVAGIIAGNGATGETDDYGALWGLGIAPGVNLVIQRLFDGGGAYYAPPSFAALTRDAQQAGADIGSNSWGDDTQGRYDISAMEFDALVRDADAVLPGDQPYILEFSAGNAGPGRQTIGSPAVGKNVIATGASQNDRLDYYLYAEGPDAMADFSSRGPAEDGRIKPDVVAPGTWISSLRSRWANDEYAWGDISGNYMFQGGTSQAGPHVSGAAAIFVQYYRENFTNATPSPALVKAALINSAVDMDDSVETDPLPNNDEGWGRVDLTQLIEPEDRSYEFVDQSVMLQTGQQYNHQVIIADGAVPLFVTLAYTDVPGFPGSIPALVNDLDLEVVAPDGRIFAGNQFFNGESVPDGLAADNLNNVECVFIGAPLPGVYTVRVRARNVPQDARIDTPGVDDQDFALVVSGALPLPGTGFVFFDRRAYTVPSRVNVTVVDADLQGQGNVNVTVRSSTQPSGVPLTLLPSAMPGTFTGSVATVSAAVAGSLRISHGDVIDTSYFDASSGALRTVTALGDLLPPTMVSVSTSNSFGKTIVTWRTDEPANGVLRYGTNSSLSRAITNRFFADTHFAALGDLVVGRTYYFLIVTEDEAGNRATNDNGGALFSFVAAPVPTVLLVDNHESDGFDLGPDIPLTVYTSALTAAGIAYDVWSITEGNPPPGFTDLQPYRVVLWRFSDNVFVDTSLSVSDQAAVQQYLQSGGSFMIASMEQLSRLPTLFSQNVLGIAAFSVDATVSTATGVVGNPVTGGDISLPLDYSNYMTETYELLQVPPDVSDTMTPGTNSFPILVDDFGEVAGIASPRVGSSQFGRVVFLSFPLDAVPESGSEPNNRAALLQRIMGFLAPGDDGIGGIVLNNSEYTSPSLVTIEVGDTDLIGSGQLTVTIASDTEPAGRTVILSEFGRFGVFRGNISLTPTNGFAPGAELLAVNGDTITATYFDTSRGAALTATATVETQPPTITGRVATPSYVDATISWDTDEPADSLVLYGESILLGRSAYSVNLTTAHEITLESLKPNTLYYYKIISRDNAGNSAFDGSDTNLYTFSTLAPTTGSWSDDFEGDVSGWSVVSIEESELQWEHGTPPSGFSAPSGSHVWGTNLREQPQGFVETYLISQPFYIVGGNRATLRFLQNYDLGEGEEDLLHIGELAIITNANYAPVTLDMIQGWDSGGQWEEAEYDLSPFAGQLVYLVWHYVYFSFQETPRIGWMIDDVEVSIETALAGTLRITNNISQAAYFVSGPFSFSGSGTSFVNTNATPGEYVITFSNVLHYLTPPPQTNTVTANNTTTFSGVYTFTDSNGNGMSDAWETAEFGTVNPGRTQFTDTDLDGMTDRAEFTAGTDPNDSASKLVLLRPATQNTGVTRFDWAVVPGRSYRVYGSMNLPNWTPLTGWERANGTVMSYTVPSTNNFRFVKVEVMP